VEDLLQKRVEGVPIQIKHKLHTGIMALFKLPRGACQEQLPAMTALRSLA
jgi:hypothetical protein